MKLMDQLKDENLGCALLYNFTKGYQKPVPMAIYDYVLPLLFNSNFSQYILSSKDYQECVKKAIESEPAIFDEIRENLEDYNTLTSKTLGFAVVQNIIGFQVEDGQVCGTCKETSILDFNEAIRLGEWFSQMSEQQIKDSFDYYSKKIVVLDGDTLGKDMDLSVLSKFGQLTIYPSTSASDTLERIKNASYVITNKVILDEKILSQAKKVEYIGITATGTNNVDLDYCQKHGITVKNVAGYSTHSVAQHTFAMLLYLYEQLPYYDQYVKSGQYAASSLFTHIDVPFHELNGKTWGIIGLGQIGKQVAKIASAFGCHVIYYSTSGQNHQDTYEETSFEELLERSDIISIHAPLNDKTYKLFNASAFAHMKRSAYLINMGRGPIIDEEELAFALKHHLLAGAALDVLCEEPMRKDHPLLPLCDSSCLVISPHSAWASIEARNELLRLVCQNIAEYISKNKD